VPQPRAIDQPIGGVIPAQRHRPCDQHLILVVTDEHGCSSAPFGLVARSRARLRERHPMRRPINLIAGSPIQPSPLCSNSDDPLTTRWRIEEDWIYRVGSGLDREGQRAPLGHTWQPNAGFGSTGLHEGWIPEESRGRGRARLARGKARALPAPVSLGSERVQRAGKQSERNRKLEITLPRRRASPALPRPADRLL
jgi:hypothetical protein